MSYLKIIVVALVFASLLSCGSSNPASPSSSPVGTWSNSLTEDVNGVTYQAVTTCDVVSGNTYHVMVLISNAGNTITLHEEQGTWSMTGSNVTFVPSLCKDYDFTSQSLNIADCSGNSVYVLSGNTLTDGSTVMTKE